jgi:hypothetical protein
MAETSVVRGLCDVVELRRNERRQRIQIDSR